MLQLQEAERPALPREEWQVHTEPSVGEDDFAEHVLQHVLRGRSATIQGPPGTGKSFLLRRIRDALVERGVKVEVLAPTNAASRW